MATGDLKGDFVNRAYSFMRVSGITKQASPEETELALQTLESMAAKWEEDNVCANYNFEDEPDLNSKHGVKRGYWLAFQLSLANILLIDKGKPLTPELAGQQRGAYSSLVTLSAVLRQTQPSRRQPLGSGNSLQWTPYDHFYRPAIEAPVSCKTNNMIIGQIDDYVEHFDAYLNEIEDIASYTLEADSGLSIVTQSKTLTDVLYRVEATGTTANTTTGYNRVKIVITTTDGRVEPRYIDFDLSEG